MFPFFFFVLLLCTIWEPCARFSSIYCYLPIKKKKIYTLSVRAKEGNKIKSN